jgi:hypothetical protein
MTDDMKTIDTSSVARKVLSLQKIAKFMGIDPDDADTIASDILPVLRRKLEVLTDSNPKHANQEEVLLKFLQSEVQTVFANYALKHLESNKNVLLFLVKKLSQAITDLRAKQIVDKLVLHADQDLADQLAAALGVKEKHIAHFKTNIVPRLKKHTKTMYRKRIANGDGDKNSDSFNRFIITNIFIDEFENHTYIRSDTDENNQAILLPKVESVVYKMIDAWKNEVMAEKA